MSESRVNGREESTENPMFLKENKEEKKRCSQVHVEYARVAKEASPV